MPNATVADARQALVDLAEQFVATGLLEEVWLTSLLLRSASGTLTATVPVSARASVEAQLLRDISRGATPDADEDTLAEAGQHAAAAGWLTDGGRRVIQLQLAGALAAQGAEVGPPVTEEELDELIDAGDVHAATAAALLVEHFKPAPEAVWHVTKSWVGTGPPPVLAKALRDHAGDLSPTERAAVVRPALEDSLAQPVHTTYLEAVLYSAADPAAIVPQLVSLYERASTPEDRRTVLKLWREFAPTSPSQRRTLIERIYIPLASRGGDDTSSAIEYFSLVDPPPKGMKKLTREALQAAATSEEQRRRLDQRLLDAGWTRKSLFFFRSDNDEDE